MAYIENPKTKGSGIICAIPQTGVCPVGCADCFFQSGRSYLEPLDKNLPNLPPIEMTEGRVVRINDGNDSNVQRDMVEEIASGYDEAFFNTSMAHKLGEYGRPVVLTVNPGKMTDVRAHLVDPCPPNLMFVRARVNPWNIELIDSVVEHYTSRDVPVVLTVMAYYTETIPEGYADSYKFAKRTLNSYWVPTEDAWSQIRDRYADNKLVHTCGKDSKTHGCKYCGNCLREYFATKERLGNDHSG